VASHALLTSPFPAKRASSTKCSSLRLSLGEIRAESVDYIRNGWRDRSARTACRSAVRIHIWTLSTGSGMDCSSVPHCEQGRPFGFRHVKGAGRKGLSSSKDQRRVKFFHAVRVRSPGIPRWTILRSDKSTLLKPPHSPPSGPVHKALMAAHQ